MSAGNAMLESGKILVWLAGLALIAGCGGGGDTGSAAAPLPAADVARGQQLYQQTCAMCHGFQGEGVERLGKPIVGSVFVRQRSDAELLRFLVAGRPADHPDNTQGVPMPPRGGNPALSDEDLARIVSYLRTLA